MSVDQMANSGSQYAQGLERLFPSLSDVAAALPEEWEVHYSLCACITLSNMFPLIH